MRLDKLMFQGVLGRASPVRLDLSGDLSRPELPQDISYEGVFDLLVALLYPDACSDRELARLEEGADPQVAVVFERKNRQLRVVRRTSRRSVQLHVRKEGGYQTASKGASAVSEVLDERLGRPPIAEFRALNLWQFEAAARDWSGSSVDPEEIGPEAVGMLEEYEQTIEIERVEERLEETRGEIEKLRERFGEGFEIEEKLREAREHRAEMRAPDLSAEEFELLREREERLEDFRAQLESLEADEREQRKNVREMEPAPPWRERTTWVGLAVGIAAVAAALYDPQNLRWVALVDIAGFGVVAWSVLKYLTDLEDVNIHKVRIESMKRRAAEVREEMAAFQEEVDHLLVHEDADDPEELLERRRRVEKLDERIEALEQRADELAESERFQEATERMDELKEELRGLERRRDELPEYGADLFQLENELQALGIDPEAALRARNDDGAGAGREAPFGVLRDLAAELGCWERAELESKTLRLWRKMAEHALGAEVEAVGLESDGTVRGDFPRGVSDPEAWLRKHPDDRRALAGTLALALHLRTISRERRVETVAIADPGEEVPAALAERLVEVFRGLTDRGHFALFGRAA